MSVYVLYLFIHIGINPVREIEAGEFPFKMACEIKGRYFEESFANHPTWIVKTECQQRMFT